jgi:tetratricopeptide (TPR) repeat protein
MITRACFILFIFLTIKGELHSQTIGASRDMVATVLQLVDRGITLTNENKLDAARQSFDTAIRVDPRSEAAYYHRARVLRLQKQWAGAVHDYDTALRLAPTFYASAIMRGNTFEHLGMYDRSLADFNRVLKLGVFEDTRVWALNERAWLLATCPNPSFRNGKQAIADAKHACNITSWQYADSVDTLAAAFAEVGDFESAIRYEEKAIAIDKKAKTKALDRADQRLAFYQRHQPVRSGPN